MLTCVLLAVLTTVTHAHVRLLYQDLTIRNAASEGASGKFSTNGPCGGAKTWAQNGVNAVKAGSTLTLKIAYNGGHKSPDNAFKLAMVCGKPGDDSGLRHNADPKPNDFGVAPVDASDSSTAGYDLSFVVPEPGAGADGNLCTVAALDQRNWGGCVDLDISPSVQAPPPTVPGAPALAPTSPPTAGIVVLPSLTGTYALNGNETCDSDSPNCCCLSGSLAVEHQASADEASATFTVLANTECTPMLASEKVDMKLTRISDKVKGLKGQVSFGNQNFEVGVFDEGLLTMANIADAPFVCSAEVTMSSLIAGGGDEGANTATEARIATGALLLPLLAALLAY